MQSSECKLSLCGNQGGGAGGLEDANMNVGLFVLTHQFVQEIPSVNKKMSTPLH